MQQVISYVGRGGSIMDVPEELRPKGYFKNTYARLLPDAPCMTITRNFGTPSSSRCIHPYQNRALSTREGARIQGFPDNYVFTGGKGSKNLQIGNAVPPALALALGKQIAGS
jgi:DNA (cytosine-5)-methyltransferase 1